MRMTLSKSANRLIKKRDLIHLTILLAIALGIGIYLIATTVLIAQDGVFYIEQAQKITTEPINVIKSLYGRPSGYAFIIFAAHKFTTFFSNSSSVFTWIYSAQGITLLCRVFSLIPLYLIGKVFTGSRNSFWAILILIVLPYPAEFGSDVIREWPHILFLSTGLLFLICGSRFGKWWMFAVAGIASGLGHTVRPECAQIVIYGILWLSINLFRARPKMGRLKSICAATLLLLGFAVIAAPYMKVRGRVLPPKLKALFGCTAPHQSDGIEASIFDEHAGPNAASALPIDILKALVRLVREISDNLMYIFVLPLVVGLYCHFHRLRKILLTERFFIFALMVLYLVMMMLLYINYDYISRRHCMPIVVFTSFYIPVGLHILARWLSRRTCRNDLVVKKNRRRLYLIFMAVGFSICTVKFVRISPLRCEKQGYLDAAKWLRENTAPKEIVAVPDNLIAFYAERTGLVYSKQAPKRANYIVRIVQNDDAKPGFGKETKEEYSTLLDKRKKSERKVVIYRML